MNLCEDRNSDDEGCGAPSDLTLSDCKDFVKNACKQILGNFGKKASVDTGKVEAVGHLGSEQADVVQLDVAKFRGQLKTGLISITEINTQADTWSLSTPIVEFVVGVKKTDEVIHMSPLG